MLNQLSYAYFICRKIPLAYAENTLKSQKCTSGNDQNEICASWNAFKHSLRRSVCFYSNICKNLPIIFLKKFKVYKTNHYS